jgi:pyrrolidone-carboxylate peptidase
MKKVLVVGFKPFGITGFILQRNESEQVAVKLKRKYNFEILILPVNDSCLFLLKSKIKQYQPDLIIGLGQDYNTAKLRIETTCAKEGIQLDSFLAKQIKRHFMPDAKENIGEWYCNDVYFESLKYTPQSIFIHLPLFVNFLVVDRIIKCVVNTVNL